MANRDNGLARYRSKLFNIKRFGVIGAGLLFLLFLTASITLAYFTASARAGGDLSFATLSVNLMTDGATLTDSSFSTKYMRTIVPGDTLSFSGISVKNDGEVDAYCLIRLDISITISDQTPFTYTKWYNLNGVEVYTADITMNTTRATYLAKNSTISTNISYIFDGDAYNNSFKTAEIDVTFSAYGIQSSLSYNETYPESNLYATYLLTERATPYTRLTYIESTGTQYIDTGVAPSYDLTYELNFTPEYNAKQEGAGAKAFFFGAKSTSTDGTKDYSFALNFSLNNGENRITKWREMTNAGAASTGSPANCLIDTTDIQQINKIELRSDRRLYYNGTIGKINDKQNDATSAYTFNDTIYLFGLNRFGTAQIFDYMKFRVYSLRMYKAGTLIRDFIPVLDGSGVACMYDLVGSKFYRNQGSSTFNSDSSLDTTTTYSAIFNANCDEQNYASGVPETHSVSSSLLNGNLNQVENIGRFYTNGFNVGDTLVISYDIEWSVTSVGSSAIFKIDGAGDVTGWEHPIQTTACGMTDKTGSAKMSSTITITNDYLKNNYFNVRCYIRYVTGGSVTIKNLKYQKMPKGASSLPEYYQTNNIHTYYTTSNKIGSTLKLPSSTPTREGYTFLGWYTAPEGGTKVTSSTKYNKVGNWQLYAHWRGVGIDPNGGTYAGSTSITGNTATAGTAIDLATPTRDGYTFTGYSLASGTGSVSQKSPAYISSLFTKTLVTDIDGTTYWNFSLNATRPTSSSWPNMQFKTYSFTAGHSYQLTFRVRVNSTNIYLKFRHARRGNDYYTGSKAYQISKVCDWTTITLTRTLDSTFVYNGTTYTTNPLFEIYTGDIKATGSNGDTAYVDFDIKDICIVDVSNNNALAFTSSIYTMGEGEGRLIANWVSNTATASTEMIALKGDSTDTPPLDIYYEANLDRRYAITPKKE